jgi:1-acyl-sn-glycerol-3-phosphate acyltransferase
LLSDLEGVGEGSEARRRATAAIGEIAARLGPDLAIERPGDDKLRSTARQLLSTDYYMRQWGRLAMRGRSEQVDEFGLDPTYEARMQSLLDVLYERYFRVEVDGMDRLPRDGGALLVCNHSGTLPWDGVMLKTAIRACQPEGRPLRWLVEDFVYHSPFVGPFLTRLGAVRACQENAQRLLSRDALVAVFPEGVKGVAKPYRERYQLQRFGRGGHVRLALRMGVPLLPVAIVGAEETYPLVYRMRSFSRLLGLPFIPVTPTFPLLGPLGLMPLPSRWRIEIGEPIGELDGLTVADADNSLRVNELNDRVRGTVQAMVNRARAARGSRVFF